MKTKSLLTQILLISKPGVLASRIIVAVAAIVFGAAFMVTVLNNTLVKLHGPGMRYLLGIGLLSIILSSSVILVYCHRERKWQNIFILACVMDSMLGVMLWMIDFSRVPLPDKIFGCFLLSLCVLCTIIWCTPLLEVLWPKRHGVPTIPPVEKPWKN